MERGVASNGYDSVDGFDDAEELLSQQLRVEQSDEVIIKAPKRNSRGNFTRTKKKGARKSKNAVVETMARAAKENSLRKATTLIDEEDLTAVRSSLEDGIELEDEEPPLKAKRTRKAGDIVSNSTPQLKSKVAVEKHSETDYGEDDNSVSLQEVRALEGTRTRPTLIKAAKIKGTMVGREHFTTARAIYDEAIPHQLSAIPLKMDGSRQTINRKVSVARATYSQDKIAPTSVFQEPFTPVSTLQQPFGRRSPALEPPLLSHITKETNLVAPLVSDAEDEDTLRPVRRPPPLSKRAVVEVSTPAHVPRDTSFVAPMSDAEDEDIRRLSGKALGKRKAIDNLVKRTLGKRTKTIKGNGLRGRDLTAYFLPQADMVSLADLEATSPGLDLAKDEQGPVVQDTQEEPGLFVSPSRPTIFASAKPATTSKDSEKYRKARSSWNTNNIPGHTEDTTKLVAKEPAKRRLPLDEPEASTSSKKRSTPATKEPKSKIAKTPAGKPKTSQAATTTTGKFSSEEIMAMTEAIENYKMMNDLSQYQLNELVQQKASTAGARELWHTVCGEVPSIPTTKLHNFCRRKYHNFEARGKWTAEQDDELREAYDLSPGKWSIIGPQINRHPEDVRDRWRNYLVCGKNMRKDAWNKEEEDRLCIVVQEYISIIKAARKRSKTLHLTDNDESHIDWGKISEKMDHTRSRLQCSQKWKKLKSRLASDNDDDVAPKPVTTSWRLQDAYKKALGMSADAKLQLLNVIRQSGAGQESKIPWGSIRNEFDNNSERRTLKACFWALKGMVAGYESMKLRDILAELISAFETSVPDEPDGFDMAFATPRTSKKERSGSRARPVDDEVPERENDETPSKAPGLSTKKRKFRERMRRADEPTQDTDNIEINDSDGQGSSAEKESPHNGTVLRRDIINKGGMSNGVNNHEELITSLESLKSSQKRKSKLTRKAKPPIRILNRPQPLSEEFVLEDEESNEEQALVNRETTKQDKGETASHHSDEDPTTLAHGFDHAEDEEANSGSDPVFLNGHHDESGEDEEPSEGTDKVLLNHHDGESDEDEEGFDDRNGNYLNEDQSEEEEELDEIHHDTESIDLDTPQTETHEGIVPEYGENETLNGFIDDDDDYISSDASSIPARKLDERSRSASVELS